MEESRPARPDAIAELVGGALAIGIVLSSEQIARFERYLDTLLLWRERLSLTSAATPHAIVRSHILDSLRVATLLEAGFRVADLGSGAGFPAVPLAIVCPDVVFVLVEAKRKKANFLREVVRTAGMRNTEVVEERVERLGEPFAARYDVVLSRAVWSLSEFLRMAAPLVRPGGVVVAMKGPRGLLETSQTASLRGPEVVRYELPKRIQRMLIIYRKK